MYSMHNKGKLLPKNLLEPEKSKFANMWPQYQKTCVH